MKKYHYLFHFYLENKNIYLAPLYYIWRFPFHLFDILHQKNLLVPLHLLYYYYFESEIFLISNS